MLIVSSWASFTVETAIAHSSRLKAGSLSRTTSAWTSLLTHFMLIQDRLAMQRMLQLPGPLLPSIADG